VSRNGSPGRDRAEIRVIDAAAGDAYLAADELLRASIPRRRSARPRSRSHIDTADGAMAEPGSPPGCGRRRRARRSRHVGGPRVGNRQRPPAEERRRAPGSNRASPRLAGRPDARIGAPGAGRRRAARPSSSRFASSAAKRSSSGMGRGRAEPRRGRCRDPESRGSGRLSSSSGAGPGQGGPPGQIDALLAADPGLAPAETSKLQAALRAIAAAEPKRGRRRPSSCLLSTPTTTTIRWMTTRIGRWEDPRTSRAGSWRGSSARVDAATPTEVESGAGAGRSGGGSNGERHRVGRLPGGRQSPRPSQSTGNVGTCRRSSDGRGTANAAAAAASPSDAPAESPAPRPRLMVGKTPGVLADDHVAEAGPEGPPLPPRPDDQREAGTRDGPTRRISTPCGSQPGSSGRLGGCSGGSFRPAGPRTIVHALREVATARRRPRPRSAARGGRCLPGRTCGDGAAGPRAAPRGGRTHRDDARVSARPGARFGRLPRWLDDYAEFVRQRGAPRSAPPDRRSAPRPRYRGLRVHAAYELVRAYEPVIRWGRRRDAPTSCGIAGKWLATRRVVREALGPERKGLIARVTALPGPSRLMHDRRRLGHLAQRLLVEHAGSAQRCRSGAIARYPSIGERGDASQRRSGAWRGRRGGGIAFRRGLGRALAGL